MYTHVFPPGCDIGMPDYHGGDVEEMEDEYDMNEPVDDMEEEEDDGEEDEYQEPAVRDSDVEEEEDEDQSVCTSQFHVSLLYLWRHMSGICTLCMLFFSVLGSADKHNF